MTDEKEIACEADLDRAVEHSRRIAKWLLDGRAALERMRVPKKKVTSEREAA
jgi:hypothetical protein